MFLLSRLSHHTHRRPVLKRTMVFVGSVLACLGGGYVCMSCSFSLGSEVGLGLKGGFGFRGLGFRVHMVYGSR